MAAPTNLTVLVHIHKAGSARIHHRHVTAVLLILFIQPLCDFAFAFNIIFSTYFNILRSFYKNETTERQSCYVNLGL